MINVSEQVWDTWEAGDFTGPNRPITRATISKNKVNQYGGTDYRTIIFNQNVEYIEIPNIKTCTINRSIGADSASFSLTMVNQTDIVVDDNLDLAHDGGSSPTRRELQDLGKPGYYTFRRGQSIDSYGENPWGHDVTEWSDIIIPNRVVFIYQGYGTDGSLRPVDDTSLVLTGIFIIDDVSYSANGTITMKGRDLAKLLIEQRLYPPIIPVEEYPLIFSSDHYEDTYEFITRELTKTETTTSTTSSSSGPNVAKHISTGYDSSVTPWYGYNGTVYGHKASDAFDGNGSTYWLSVGNSGPNEVWSYEWIGANCGGNPINKVKFKPKWGGYVCWVAVRTSAGWQGSSKVPYGATSEPAYPNGSDVPFVRKVNVPKSESWFEVDLPGVYNAEEIRIVFSNLADSDLGTYQYRAGVYEVQAYLYKPSTSEESTTEVVYQVTDEVPSTEFVEGNIDDYTDIVKLFCAWSGFYWPEGPTDEVLKKWDPSSNGRVWGDFFNSGAYPVEPWWISPDYWDNKSVMDGINQLREILGFTFYIDHAGGVVWRPPNIWRTGNYISGLGYIGEDSIRDVHEERVLVEYDATLNDAALRSDIVVVSAEDPSIYASWSPGASGEEATVDVSDLELLAGQIRVSLISDYPFISQEEVDKFAYLIALRSHWSFRKSKFKIPGNPALTPDDQVRIYERTTSETYIHYLLSVNSTMDMDSGTWYMDVDTHWLGNGPDSQWSMITDGMSPALFAYLRAIGQIVDDREGVSPFPDSFFEYGVPDIELDPLRDYTDISGVIIPDLPTVNDTDSTATTEDPFIPPTGDWSSGEVTNCSNDYRWAMWVGAGPRFVGSSPSDGLFCYTGNLRKIVFMQEYQTYWDLFPLQKPDNTFAGQNQTVTVQIDYRTVNAFLYLAKIMAEEEYPVYSTYGYSCRGIKLTNGGYSETWSNHSWGAAVDVNAADNPQGTSALYVPNSAKLLKVASRATSLRTVSGNKTIFRWGGNWSGSYVDPMHFEVCVEPDFLKSGIVEP